MSVTTQRAYKAVLVFPKNKEESYPPYDRYGRTPKRFFCRNCIIFIDTEIVAEKHSEVTGHTVDEIL